CGRERDREVGQGGGDVDERPARLAELWQRRPETVDAAEEIDVEHAAELVVCKPVRLRMDGDHGVRDVGVDPAEAVDGFSDEAIDVLPSSDVDLDREPSGTGGLDLADGRIERLTRPRADDDLGAAVGSGPRDRTAEPIGVACDDDDLL